jgi:hypothetical protein
MWDEKVSGTKVIRNCHGDNHNVMLTVGNQGYCQLDVQIILSIFCQPLHVAGVSRPIIRRYNRMYTTIGTSYSF